MDQLVRQPSDAYEQATRESKKKTGVDTVFVSHQQSVNIFMSTWLPRRRRAEGRLHPASTPGHKTELPLSLYLLRNQVCSLGSSHLLLDVFLIVRSSKYGTDYNHYRLQQYPHLPDVVMTLLETQTSETQGRLPTSTVLLGEVHAELVQHISCAKGKERRTDQTRTIANRGKESISYLPTRKGRN